MKKNVKREPNQQNEEHEMQSEKTKSTQQKETAGKIIFDYIKKEIDRER